MDTRLDTTCTRRDRRGYHLGRGLCRAGRSERPSRSPKYPGESRARLLSLCSASDPVLQEADLPVAARARDANGRLASRGSSALAELSSSETRCRGVA